MPEFSKKSIYLTGKAGTGKSTYLRYISSHTKKKYIIVAPTGIAAINAGGVTINSFFQFSNAPFIWNLFTDEDKKDFYRFRQEKIDLIKELDLIIIDEISMVRSDIVDAIDFRLRHFGGKKHLPFGGKQVLFVGDAFQLEPVAKNDEWNILKEQYTTPYFFGAKVFKEVNFIGIELLKVFRQTDQTFISILNKIRVREANRNDLELLNKSFFPNFNPLNESGWITITTKRFIVDVINNKRLIGLPGISYKFEGILEGTFGDFEDNLPTNKLLELKQGAQIMFVNNDKKNKLVNGTIGEIESVDKSNIYVKLKNGDIHCVQKHTWYKTKYELDNSTGKIEKKIIGSFTQYPIKLAWAITIHKSQGLSFDNVVIDMADGAFTAGHTYVALSRCKTLEGIKLRVPIRSSDIIVSNQVLAFNLTVNNKSVIHDAISKEKANYYYLVSLRAFKNGSYSEAYEILLKAFEIRDDSRTPVFKRFLSFLFFKLKNKKEIELEYKIEDLHVRIEHLNTSIKVKDEQIAKQSKMLIDFKTFDRKITKQEKEIDKLNIKLDDKLNKIVELSNEIIQLKKQLVNL